jgi:hypothetical protein
MPNLARNRARIRVFFSRRSFRSTFRLYVLVLTIVVVKLCVLDADELIELPQEVVDFATKTSDKTGYVFLMFFNSGYMKFVNSWICNMRLVDADVLKQTLFVAADDLAAEALITIEPTSHIFNQHTDSKGAVTYGTYPYFELTIDRLRVQNSLLQKGANVFVIEADAIWFSPIAEYVESIRDDGIISANDRTVQKPLISAGFSLVSCTQYKFFNRYVSRYASNLKKFENFKGSFDEFDPGEQHLMTKLLLARKRHMVTWLSECHFARGEWYTDEKYRMRCPHPKVIQNNYFRGMENKIERAKEWGHWFLNQDGTCKSHIPVINPRGEYDKSCETALHSLESSILGTELHKSVIDILSLVDHAFILSVERCKSFYVPVQLRGKLTCVVGREIDDS